MWNQDNTAQTVPGLVPISSTITSGGRGWFGTATVGCDYQVSSSFVIGAYGDWDFGDIKGTPEILGFAGNESEKWAWSAGARIGYLLTPTVLGYFSGGYTQAHFDPINVALVVAPFTPAGVTVPAQTYNGWFLGSGFDYAISILPSGFFLRTEYRYSTFNAADLSVVSNTTGLPIGAGDHSKKFVQSVRSELIWRFNFGH
jgi:outer membrane immunogenic protein